MGSYICGYLYYIDYVYIYIQVRRFFFNFCVSVCRFCRLDVVTDDWTCYRSRYSHESVKRMCGFVKLRTEAQQTISFTSLFGNSVICCAIFGCLWRFILRTHSLFIYFFFFCEPTHTSVSIEEADLVNKIKYFYFIGSLVIFLFCKSFFILKSWVISTIIRKIKYIGRHLCLIVNQLKTNFIFSSLIAFFIFWLLSK